MKGKLVASCALSGLVVAALLTLEGSPSESTDAVANRIVQAPPTAADARSAAIQRNVQAGDPQADPGGSHTAVAVTMIGGTLYLVTADTDDAAKAAAATVAGGDPPEYRCDQAAGTESSPGPEARFSARPIPAYGGTGALPPMTRNFRLMDEPASGAHLTCTLINAPGK